MYSRPIGPVQAPSHPCSSPQPKGGEREHAQGSAMSALATGSSSSSSSDSRNGGSACEEQQQQQQEEGDAPNNDGQEEDDSRDDDSRDDNEWGLERFLAFANGKRLRAAALQDDMCPVCVSWRSKTGGALATMSLVPQRGGSNTHACNSTRVDSGSGGDGGGGGGGSSGRAKPVRSADKEDDEKEQHVHAWLGRLRRFSKLGYHKRGKTGKNRWRVMKTFSMPASFNHKAPLALVDKSGSPIVHRSCITRDVV